MADQTILTLLEPSAKVTRRAHEAGCVLELALAAVVEELRLVVADRRRVGVLAALHLGGAEDQRPLEGLGLVGDRLPGEVVGADLVVELDHREHRGHARRHPRVRRQVGLAELGHGVDHGLGRGIRRIGGQARGDAVVPLRHVAAEALGHDRRQAQRVGDHRRLDARLLERLGRG
jgi:hypothetical protein